MATRNEIELLIKARDEASKALDDVTKKIQGLDGAAGPASSSLGGLEKSAGGVGQRILEMAGGFLTAQVAFAGMQRAADLLVGAFEKGIKSIDELRLAQAAMAGAAATNDPSIGFEKAYDIAGKMVQRVQLLSATFVGTGDELAQLAQAMVTFGLGLDLSNEKAEKNFISFANMFKIMTAGQDFQRQVMSEIRALAQGQEVAGAMVVRYLEAAGINVKQMVPIWKEQGTLLENIMKVMSGYDAATDKIANTLQTQKTTLETITYKILREGTQGAYDDILGMVKKINTSLMDQDGFTENARQVTWGLKFAWDGVKTVLDVIGNVLENTILRLTRELGALVKKTGEIAVEQKMLSLGEISIDLSGGAPEDYQRVVGEDVLDDIRKTQERLNKLASGDSTLKLPPSPPQATEAQLKAAESLAKKIEALYDKIAIEAARKRGGDVAAELEKARVEWINRQRDIEQLQVTGKIGPDERREQDLVNLRAYQNEKAKILDKERDRERAETDKMIADEAKGWAKRNEELRKAGEKAAEIYDRLLEMQRQYAERVPRPWDEPGEKERRDAFHRFNLEKNNLEEQRRKGPSHGGITEERYEFLSEENAKAYQAKLAQIEDATDESKKRQSRMWDEMFGGLDRTASDLFFDAFSGKLKTMGDYFDAALNVMRRAWANFLSDMLTKWMETQARTSMASGGGFGGFLSGLFGGGGGGASAAGGADWFETMGGGELIMAAGGGVFPGSFVPIRAFSGGGVASRPTLGMIAEAGVSEAVVPMPSGKIPVELRGDRGGGTPSVNFYINAIDSRSVRQMLVEERGTLTAIWRNEYRNAGAVRDQVRR